MKKIFLGTLVFFFSTLHGQLSKKVIVEHFTNTKCSICAARNPGLYTNLNNHPGILHLAIHPSSPYSGCLLYQQDASENDARTNYYGVYGGTPRIVVSGSVIPASADYSNTNLLDGFEGNVSPAAIKISQIKFSADSIRSSVVVKTMAAHTLPVLSLFAALAEDTVFYQGSNGEPRHYDVLRKALNSVTGQTLVLPAQVGDSLLFTFTATANPLWNFERINTYVILQEHAIKSVVQAEKYGATPINLGLKNPGIQNVVRVLPNPSTGIFIIEGLEGDASWQLKDAEGRLLKEGYSNNGLKLDMSTYGNGVYFFSSRSGSKSLNKKLVLLKD